MSLFDDTVPPNSEGVKLGAQRIREAKTLLNSTLGSIFSAASTWVSNVIPGASIKNNEVTGTQLQSDGATDANRAVNTNHIRDLAVTAPKIAAGAVSDGLVKAATNNPISVNVDAATIDFDASNPKKIKVKDKGIGSTQIADNLYAANWLWVQDEQAAGTPGQNINTNPTPSVRILNTVKVNNISGASLNAGTARITLPAGTYRCRISAPARQSDSHRIALVNETDSNAILLWGTSEYQQKTAATAVTRSHIVGTFTLSGVKVLKVWHYVSDVTIAMGGVAGNFGAAEIYTVAEFWKDA